MIKMYLNIVNKIVTMRFNINVAIRISVTQML